MDVNNHQFTRNLGWSRDWRRHSIFSNTPCLGYFSSSQIWGSAHIRTVNLLRFFCRCWIYIIYLCFISLSWKHYIKDSGTCNEKYPYNISLPHKYRKGSQLQQREHHKGVSVHDATIQETNRKVKAKKIKFKVTCSSKSLARQTSSRSVGLFIPSMAFHAVEDSNHATKYDLPLQHTIFFLSDQYLNLNNLNEYDT